MRRAGWGLIGAGAIALALWFPGFLVDMRQVLQVPLVLGIDAQFSNLQEALLDWEGGRWGRHGWYLSPGQEGRVRLQLPGNLPGIVKLKIRGYDPGRVVVRVEEMSTTHPISSSALQGNIVNVAVEGPTHLLISASNLGMIDQLILESVTAAWFPKEAELPSAWPLVLSLALVLIGFCWLIARPGNRSSGLFSGETRRLSIWLGCAALYMALVVGMDLRWSQFDLARSLPLDPDVLATWWPYARDFQWGSKEKGFYSGAFGMREPLYVAVLHYWLLFWGDASSSPRWFTLCLSGLLIPVVGVFVWGLTGRWWIGTLAAWVVALSPEWISLATRGLRDETTTLLLVGGVSVWLWSRGWVGTILLGFSMGLLSLARSSGLSIELPLIWGVWLVNQWRFYRGRDLLLPAHWGWIQLAVASALGVALYVPYLHGVSDVYGEMSWPTSQQARYNANFEFPERLGTPGWPSEEEFASNSYAGPSITFSQYLFGLHSVPFLISGQIKGWLESTGYLAVSPTPRLDQLKHMVWLYGVSGFGSIFRHVSLVTAVVFGILAVSFLVGWIGLWRETQYQWIPLFALWGTWYAAFMHSIGLNEPFRHTCHVYPLILFCQLWGAWWLLSRLRLLPRQLQIEGKMDSASSNL